MLLPRLLPIVLAVLVCANGEATAGSNHPPSLDPGKATPPKVTTAPAAVPTAPPGVATAPPGVTTPPAPAKAPPLPIIVFYVARGDANACGHGCDAWIAAEGTIDLDAAYRLRTLLTKLGHRKLPIFFHSPGGSVNGSLDLGRLIRERKLDVSVARTIPRDCERDKLFEKPCETLKRSGQELEAEFDQVVAMCNSACVLALAGGVTRLVPPWVRLGIHDIGLDRSKKNEVSAAVIAETTRITHAHIADYLHAMGINDGLAAAAAAVPNETMRPLDRAELVRFGIDRREFGEAVWQFTEKPMVRMAKWFFMPTGDDRMAYSYGFLRLTCGTGTSVSLTYARQHVAAGLLGAAARPLQVKVNGTSIDMPHAVRAGEFDLRSSPVLAHVFDSADDTGTIELSGAEVARNGAAPGNGTPNQEAPNVVTLNMDQFSTAYAKLHAACEETMHASSCPAGDLSPRCAEGTLATWPTLPTAFGAPPAAPAR